MRDVLFEFLEANEFSIPLKLEEEYNFPNEKL
jgi:hypothetical protein